jgi:Cdc6-like AAA superfamily ATPase
MKDTIRLRMKNAIKEIIEEIRPGRVFDSHYVINQLISEHSDVYLLFASELINSQETAHERKITSYIHSQISQKIGDSGLVTRVEWGGKEVEFWSDNIHEKASKCAGWRRT